MLIIDTMILGDRYEPFLEYAIKSVLPSVDLIVINYNGKNLKSDNIQRLKQYKNFIEIFYTKFEDFSRARNDIFKFIIENSLDNSWCIWHDADEVHIPSLQELTREIIPSLESIKGIDGLKTAFYHFLTPNIYQSIDERCNIFKFNKDLKWQGETHEKLIGINNIIYTNYKYFHYSYIIPQNKLYKGKWEFYAKLENKNIEQYKNECGDIDNIITDRIVSGTKFEGEHPEIIKKEIERLKNGEDIFGFSKL